MSGRPDGGAAALPHDSAGRRFANRIGREASGGNTIRRRQAVIVRAGRQGRQPCLLFAKSAASPYQGASRTRSIELMAHQDHGGDQMEKQGTFIMSSIFPPALP
ncbi:hypothetical protein CN97_08465 [Haematobacter massiliensis]|uniref:Uncharacterized protein n=1 Tax=Haematobacter massiliensis TaxID=195105 RepID=A0A086XTJ5_9RHOB|nr:hypothetical protein CN97_08465 [Haematobacter massiliensis]